MAVSDSSLQMPSSEKQCDDSSGARDSSMQNNESELEKCGNEVRKRNYEDVIDCVARGIFCDGQNVCSNELSSKKEEFAPVPNPNNALPPEEEAQGSELTREQTPEPTKISTGKLKPLMKRSYTLLKHKDVLAPKKLEFKKSFSKKSKVLTSSADSDDSQQVKVSKSNKLNCFRSKTQRLSSKPEDPRLDLIRLQHMRCETGVWVQCISCSKWRYLATINDPQNVHPKWQCSMNSDPNFASCSIEEVGPSPEEEMHMVYAPFSVGSLVWAQMAGFPWWPAMVDDDPDFEQYYWLNDYSDIPTYYNVVFFDSEPVTRAWITPNSLKPYIGKEQDKELCKATGYGKDYKKRMEVAVRDAELASSLNVSQRLQKFSFISRYLGKVGKKRKKTKKQNENSKKHRKKHISDESSLCSEDSYELRKAQMLSLSQADNVKIDVGHSVNRRKKQKVVYSSQSSSSYSSSEELSASSSYCSDVKKAETCEDSSFSSASSNSPIQQKKMKQTKNNCEVKSLNEKDNTKKEKLKPLIKKKSFEGSMKSKTYVPKKSGEGIKHMENKPTTNKTALVEVENNSASVILPKNEDTDTQQNLVNGQEPKKMKPVKPKFGVSNLSKPTKNIAKKKQTCIKINEKSMKTKEVSRFSSLKSKKGNTENKLKGMSGVCVTNLKESLDSPNINENDEVPSLTEVKLVDPDNNSSDVLSCGKSQEKQIDCILNQQQGASCSQSQNESKPKKRKLPQFVVPRSKKQDTNKNSESEDTSTNAKANPNMQMETVQVQVPFTEDKKEGITVTKTEKTVDSTCHEKGVTVELSKNDIESNSKVVAQVESMAVENEELSEFVEKVNESNSNVAAVKSGEKILLGTEKEIKLVEEDSATSANKEQSAVQETNIETNVQNNVQEPNASGSSVELQSEINETAEMPGTSEVNTETPDCSGVIDEVLTNFSEENLEFFNPSSPLFDMEE